MSLTVADFEGFNLNATQCYLKSFDARTSGKGEHYFRQGAVDSIPCDTPGTAYSAKVLGSEVYDVNLFWDDGWDAECSCPVGYECKHVYAAAKQLLAEHSSAVVADLSSASRKGFPIPRVIVPLEPAPQPAKE
jgi:uncharacterized Zn finger protein